MPYLYLEDIATSDVAFRAWSVTLEGLFADAADATTNTMVQDLGGLEAQERRAIRVEDSEIDLLLFRFLEELVFLKDAQQLLLRVRNVRLQQDGGSYTCSAEAYGEKIDPARHSLIVDVKAVTLHRLRVAETDRGWEATVILDV